MAMQAESQGAHDADGEREAAEAKERKRKQMEYQMRQVYFLLAVAMIGFANVWRISGKVPLVVDNAFVGLGFPNGFPKPEDVLPAAFLPSK